jgi:hypothetical protein
MIEERPIIRDLQGQRYWFNEGLLEVQVHSEGGLLTLNIAEALILIVDAYVDAKKSAFESFIRACSAISLAAEAGLEGAAAFIESQLKPNVDARIFEIVSFAILKAHYGDKSIFWGWTADELSQEFLVLYKTGRTNANDGGIDFVMRPLGRFFQVTETMDASKYFLDIDKVQHFPITFVVKTSDHVHVVLRELERQAKSKYRIDAVVRRYLESVEEIINIPRLMEIFGELAGAGLTGDVMSEIVLQSKVEFNSEDDEEGEMPGEV